jgi:hypothetical protein
MQCLLLHHRLERKNRNMQCLLLHHRLERKSRRMQRLAVEHATVISAISPFKREAI